MNPWLRRILYLLVIIVWLLIISLPFFSFALAARSQIQVGSTEGDHVRIFLIQEKDAEGIGLEITRSTDYEPNCIQTSVRYFMWKGYPEDVTYCQCMDPDTGKALSATSGACSSK